MDKALDAIRDAWDKEAGDGRDEDKARQLADKYVAAHPDQFAQMQTMSIHDCVKAVDVFRAAGMADDQWRAEVWLLHHFEPQVIGGPADATVRFPGKGN